MTSSAATELGRAVASHLKDSRDVDITSIEILTNLRAATIPLSKMLISSDQYLDENAAGLVIFTSGTTGPPKGVVMRRAFMYDVAMAMAEDYNITSDDVVLHLLPVHHVTGLGVTFFPFLVAGACIEFRSNGFDPAWVWDRLAQGGISFFSGVPTIYMRMMRFYEEHIANLGLEKRQLYVNGVSSLRAMACGSSALPKPIQDFWTGIRDGKPILQRYGATEFGPVFKVSIDEGELPDGSVGTIVAGVDVKLSDGDEGEVLVRSPYMFAGYVSSCLLSTPKNSYEYTRYLFDGTATAAAHDAEGYFRTGDIARREGDYFWIMGRASLDIIKSGGYKLSALDIEREILGLPYISEAVVVGVADDEFGQRVGAIVTLRRDQDKYDVEDEHAKLTLNILRQDLRGRLAGYKLPTLLRVYNGDLPKGQSGKVPKKQLGEQLFPSGRWQTEQDVQKWVSKHSSKLAKL